MLADLVICSGHDARREVLALEAVMKQLKELTIVTPNKPGKLSRALNAVARAKVNLIAIDSSSGYDLNMVRLVVADAVPAHTALEKLGYSVTETNVLAVTLLDKPGQLAKITALLGKSNVNIDYMYATAVADGREARVIFHLSDVVAGERALRKAGIGAARPAAKSGPRAV
jgi:hypothetical protein